MHVCVYGGMHTHYPINKHPLFGHDPGTCAGLLDGLFHSAYYCCLLVMITPRATLVADGERL
jgi:hypothetical protein